MDRNLALEVARVTEAAALASARFMGRGDEAGADRAAVEAMRRAFNAIAVGGTVVIGEGTQEQTRALYVGEKIGGGDIETEVALDALEGASITATGGPGALSIIAIAEPGVFFQCPDTYMEKIAVGPEGRGAIDITRAPKDNLKALAEAKGVYVEDLTVVVLERPRHAKLIREVRQAGARIKLLGAGDLSAALATTHPESGIDLLIGVGGGHQGMLAAAALRCAGGDMQARLAPLTHDERERCYAAGLTDLQRVYKIDDLVRGDVMFAATGVTTGDFLGGVRFFRGGATTNSVVMRSQTRTVRFIETTHHFDFKPEY
ncbi:MAG: class II fructose-bisphosphatase [Deltaproteobacteria bacterium]|nr:class II fructose-bisphosphatase [Deltaproteobacteria bacterium]